MGTEDGVVLARPGSTGRLSAADQHAASFPESAQSKVVACERIVPVGPGGGEEHRPTATWAAWSEVSKMTE